MQKARLIIAVVAAFSLGWWSRGWLQQSPGGELAVIHNTIVSSSPTATPTPEVEEEGAAQVVYLPDNVRFESADAYEPEELAEPETADLERFRQLLEKLKYSQAMQLLSEREASLPVAEAQQWRSALVEYLKVRLNHGETALFKELSELRLQYNYSDIEVLLLQAQYHRVLGHQIEALNTYMQAGTYAYTDFERDQVNDRLHDFIVTRDHDYAEHGEWYELLGFYEHLQEVGINKPIYLYRYAELLLMHSDLKSAEILLQELAAIPGWKAKVRQLKEEYLAAEGNFQAGTYPGYNSAIDLKPVGSHYLLTVQFNGEDSANLLLDTGATISMLTVRSFAGLVRPDNWEDLGWRFFNTANGVARGRLMRTGQMQLGPFTLADLDISVQEVDMGEGIDGLLGMNVLSQFHFQIDQDNHRLLLTPRQ